ncbi:hypothetical protein RvY_12449 [Ramazzottius varieornatus]|uniref:Uncharacterized protein n=1 Tax=Ramazzottius varieornatus TaxID=947166 RepID=A0A1D1VJJ4_RAMVA|nr:hypothetical protein RvY_12449 [Ramazzottius varieornatus]
MAVLSSKERHCSIEEAVYKVFEIPEALQEFSQQNVEKDQSRRQGIGVTEEDSSRDPSSGSASAKKDGQGEANATGSASQDGRRPLTASSSLRDPAKTAKKGRFSETKSSQMGRHVRQNDRNDREDDRRSTSEDLYQDGDDAWEDVGEKPVLDLKDSLKGKGGTRKQQLVARQVRANYARQKKIPARTYSNSTLRAMHKINLGTLKESDYVGLDLPQWCDIEESILSPDKTVETSPSAGLITQHAHLGYHLHDASSTSDLLGLLSANTSDKVGELRDLLPEDENFGLGDSPLKMLEKADDETLRDIMHVYYPSFQKRSELKVDYDAYYESEPDTLSCCSDPPTVEEENQMERRAWTIQMSEIFQMLAANVGHLTSKDQADQ